MMTRSSCSRRSSRGSGSGEGTGQLASFTLDGRYSVDDGGVLGVDPDDTGHFEIDGDTFVMSTDGTASCAAGTTVTWTAAMLDKVKFTEDDGLVWRLRLTAPDNDCVGWTSGEQTWLRVSTVSGDRPRLSP